MKKGYLKRTALAFVMIFTFSTTAGAQTLEETLQTLSSDAAEGYLGPIVSAFGANLNSGWVHGAPEATMLGLDIDIKLVATAAFFDNATETFSTTGKFRFNQQQAAQLTTHIADPNARAAVEEEIMSQFFDVTVAGPTIVGSDAENVNVTIGSKTISANGNDYTIGPETLPLTEANGKLNGLPMLPLFAPQLTLGTVYGTNVSFRYLPTIEIHPEIGDFNYFGFGIMHNPFMWVPAPMPVDIALGFFTQSMEAGKNMQVSSTYYGLFASKTFGAIVSVTPYVGLSMESSSVQVTYDYQVSDPSTGLTTTLPIDVEFDGENSFRLLLGAKLSLPVVTLAVDYGLAQYSAASLSLMFGF